MSMNGKLYKIGFPFLLALFWFWLMNTSLTIKDNSLPPLGFFLSPSTGFWWNALWVDQNLPKELSFSGVDGEVVFDERMVPHIFAANDHQAYFIQGYLHALHRLWQMDFSTRAAEGRLSEIIGERTLEFDKLKRRKGLAMAARMSVEHWKKDSFMISRLESYAKGVNAFISSLNVHELPIEYKILNYKPEAWSLYRSALFHKSMAEILCGRDKDLELSNAKEFFKEDFNMLFPEMDAYTDPVIPPGTKWSDVSNQANFVEMDTSTFGYFPFEKEKTISGLGSNNWAVGPDKSLKGHPVLCNDPHLSLTLPNIWYEQQIVTPEYNVYGVTFPGIAGVVIGYNKHVAWGVTNAGWDVLDWYRITWKDPDMSSYLLDGHWVQTNVRLDTIIVKNKGYVVDTVRMTHWGPVIYTDPAHKKYSLAMHWIVHDPYEQQEFRTFMSLNRARNFEDYRKACTHFPYPAQNIVFASSACDVALTVSGNMPLKSNQMGRFVMDGSSSQNKWAGFLDPLSNPSIRNPQRGFVSSANQRSTDPSFPIYFNDGDFRSFRGALLNRILASRNDWTVEDMKELQYNNHSLKAETALPAMLALLEVNSLSGQAREIYNELASWNFSYDSTSRSPVYFELWFDHFYKLVWDELTSDFTKMAIAYPNEMVVVDWLSKQPANVYFDLEKTEKREAAKDIVQMSFDSLINNLKTIERVKDWADYKAAEIVHIARIPAFGKFNVRSSGNEDIINAHAKVFGPSWRMIVELQKDSIIAYGIYPGGQSGHPGSIHYEEMIEPWAKGNYFLLNYWNQTPEPERQKIRIRFKGLK